MPLFLRKTPHSVQPGTIMFMLSSDLVTPKNRRPTGSDSEMKASTASSALGGSQSSPEEVRWEHQACKPSCASRPRHHLFGASGSPEAPGQPYSTQKLAPLPFRLLRSKSKLDIRISSSSMFRP